MPGLSACGVQVDFNAPVRTTKYPREIPPLPWYRKAPAQMLMAGFLPFSAIYIELYYIFASVWGHKVRIATTVRLPLLCSLLAGYQSETKGRLLFKGGHDEAALAVILKSKAEVRKTR